MHCRKKYKFLEKVQLIVEIIKICGLESFQISYYRKKLKYGIFLKGLEWARCYKNENGSRNAPRT